MDTANEAPNNVESSEPNENGNISNEDEEVFATSGGNGDITTAKFKLSQVRRQNAQKNAFTRWLNSKLKQGDYTSQIVITDLFRDLTDGNILLSLLESLTGRKMRRIKGSMKLHHLNNVNLALGLLKDYQVKLVNIGNTDIVDGKPIPTLGLIWSMIYRFQIQGALIDIHPGDNDRSSFEDQNVEQTILDWCSKGIEGYEGVDVTNFSTSWKDGLAFNALIHRYKPNLFHYETALTKSPAENLEHAFTAAETAFAVPRLLEPTDLQHDPIDSRLVVMYVSTLYEKLRELDPKEDDTVTCEEIEEFLSYIQTEMNYLTSCEEYFMTCSNIEDLTDDEEIIKEYQELQGLIESLQPHEIKVGELVRQIEKLIKVELIPEEDCQALQVELDKLKELWQDVFDRTTARHDKLCKRMSNLVDKPLKCAYDSLNEYKDRLKDFSTNETDLQNAWQQYTNLLAFIEELRRLENDIEDIRTGSEVGGALGALSEQDEHLVSDNIKELITSFMELGESVADAKYRISENLHEVLRGNMENIENVLMTTQEATEKEANNNNNLETEDVKKRLQILKDIENALLDTKRDLDHVTSICESLDESFSIDDVSAVELKNHAGELDEEYIEQQGCLHGLIEQ